MAKWFRKKRVGYGWTPCTWQGWLVMAIFTAAVLAVVARANSLGPQTTLVIVAAVTVALLVVAAFTSGKDSDP